MLKHAKRSSFDPEDPMDFFAEYRGNMSGRYFCVYKMILGDLQVVSLFEVTDREAFARSFESPATVMKDRLKLITCPANLPIRLPLKGPNSADTVEDYFGSKNCAFALHHKHGGTYACITIDIFSKWIIKKVLPSVAFTKGRICDFIVIDYPARSVVCGLRVICTKAAMTVLRDEQIDEREE